MTDQNDVIILEDNLWQEFSELTHGAASPCFQCGVCTATCPWAEVGDHNFNVRNILRAAQLGNLQDLEDLWLCSACLLCEASCPRGVPISAVLRDLRYLLWQRRIHLSTLPATLWSCYWNNNPLGQPPSARMDWAAGLGLEDFNPGIHEWLLYIGCTASYDRRAQQVARSAVELLRSADVAFGVLGLDEPCCGESVLRLGHTPFFREMAQKAVDVYARHQVEKMVVISPHCFDVFRKNYHDVGAEFEVQHITQLVASLIEAGRIQLQNVDELRITYHDPCLLGRGNGEYEAPRQILQAIPGVEFIPIDPDGEEGLCCGGGGGRMFLETPAGERFGDIRVEQARKTGATVLATACPLCIACLEDSMKVVDGAHMIVQDVLEIAASTLDIA